MCKRGTQTVCFPPLCVDQKTAGGLDSVLSAFFSFFYTAGRLLLSTCPTDTQ